MATKKKAAVPAPIAPTVEPVLTSRQKGGSDRIPKYPTEGWCLYELRANGVKVGTGKDDIEFAIAPMIKALRSLGYDVEKYSKTVVAENTR